MMKQYNVLVCGTNFGAFYISALRKQGIPFALCGILSKGSERSKKMAKELNVSLYTSTDELPHGIDLACVVIKSSLLGGQGTSLAINLMKRGIHVIQEHPVHSGDIRACLKVAQENNVYYHVNSHFVHVRPVRIFLEYVRRTLQTERALFIEVTTSLLYSSLDIIGQALGTLEPFSFSAPQDWNNIVTPASNNFLPFKSLQGIIGDVSVTFTLQNYFGPKDLDRNYLIMHRLSIGSEGGNTTLLSSHGPVTWTQGYPLPEKGEPLSHSQTNEMPFNQHINCYQKYYQPTFVVFGEPIGPSYNDVVNVYWPEAILRSLGLLKDRIETGVTPFGQSAKYLQSLSDGWINLMKQFDKPHLMEIAPVENKIPDPISFLDEMTKKTKNL